MTEPDYATCLNHVVDVLVFEIESPGEWEKAIVVMADIGRLVPDLQKSAEEPTSLKKRLTINFVTLYTVL